MTKRRYSNWLVFPCLLAATQVVAQTGNSIELGTGYSSVDSNRFGRYTGLHESGGYALGAFTLQNSSSETQDNFWSVTGRNLGLDSAGLAASYTHPGLVALTVKYQQLPYYGLENARTPFIGSGTAVQKLPSNWQGASNTAGFTALSSSLKEFSIDKQRERFSTGFDWQVSEHWKLRSEYRHETKQGNDVLAAMFGSTGGNPRSALLARPIDFVTNDVSMAVDFGRAASQFSVSYNILDFSNKDNSLLWTNPFNNPQWTSGANFSNGATGQLALEPDNISHQWSLNGGHSLGKSTRVSGSISSISLEQDDRFLPFSNVLPTPTALPRSSLDGQVDTLIVNLNLSSRLGQRTALRARYNYRDRDNQTRQDIFQRVAGDAAPQVTLLSSGSRVNRIYDLQRSRYEVELDYRFTGKTRLTAGYQVEKTDRSMVDVDTTEEDTSFLRLNFSPFANTNGWIKLSRSERDVSNYNSEVPFVAGHNPEYVATLVGNDLYENDPLLRRYHLSERDRDEAVFSFSVYPGDVWGVTASAKIRSDDFPSSIIGLQSSDSSNFAIDLSYAPQADFSANAYYSYDHYLNKQAGYARRGGGNPTPFFPASVRLPGNNFAVRSEDKVYVAGAGLNWEMLEGKLSMLLDGNYSDAITETSPFSTGLAWAPFPDISTEIATLSLRGDYQLEEGRELRMRYFYQRFKSSDWALDGVSVNTLANVLLLGNQSPAYDGGFIEISLLFRFE